MSATASTLSYRRDIDGLRAVAVVPVVLFHAGFDIFSGGYVGVDVFFVISGYLITSLIAPQVNAGTFSYRQFYERRIRRLFPALFALIAACSVAAWWLLMPEELEDFGQSVATTSLFSANFLFFSEDGYFEGPAEQKPLLHTWSLAVEEQFYLLFPPLLLLLKRRWPTRLTLTVAGLFGASLLWSSYAAYVYPTATFYLLPARTWELLLGALLALAHLQEPSRAGRGDGALGALGLALIAYAVLTFDSTTVFPGLSALLPCAGTALLIHSGRLGDSLIARLLALPPLVFVGLISYSLYLWHWPVIVFAKHYLIRPPTLPETLAMVLVGIGLAVLSWRYVEQPFRGRDGVLTSRRLFQATAAVMVTAIAVGLLFDESEGLPARLDSETRRIAAYLDDKPRERRRCEGIPPEAISYERLCRIAGDAPPTFMVWGDSHAGALMPAVREAAQALGVNGLNATSNGCPPLLNLTNVQRDPQGICLAFNDAVLAVLREHPEVHTVWMLGRWPRYAQGTPYGSESGRTLLLRTRDREAGSLEENHAMIAAAYEATLQQLEALNRRVVVLGPIPEIGHIVPNSMAKAQRLHRDIELRLPRAAFDQRNARVLQMLEAGAHERAQWAPLHNHLCDDDWCAITQGETPLYSDDDHLSSVGAARFNALFETLLREPRSRRAGSGEDDP
ncbi:MAG: acyltransferase family protein [Pseudomonadota bacterium]